MGQPRLIALSIMCLNGNNAIAATQKTLQMKLMYIRTGTLFLLVN